MIDTAVWSILWLSFRIALISTILNIPAALTVAWILARKEFRGKALFDGIVNLPLVIPPVVTGYILLMIFGRNGMLGSHLNTLLGIQVSFTTAAAVMAAMVVSFPLMARSIRVALEMADPGLEQAAATLGASRLEVWRRVTLPLAFPGIAGGIALGFARALGEFGATMVFAGNIPDVSRTVPLAVHALIQSPGREKEAALLVGLSVAVSLTAMLISAKVQSDVP
ncbi:MAG: molybdate ABC transporter permease subunit [Spirochaetaceae bacterium]|nr:molybdate ABC transporter permease subunit [Spirochaetaceae bacterium]